MGTDKQAQRRVSVDRQNAVSKDAYVFPKSEDWVFQGDAPQTLQMDGEPGTWSKPPEVLAGLAFGVIQALIRCPNCFGVSILAKSVTQIDEKGRLYPDFSCTHHACNFRRVTYLDEWNDKTLYALAFVRRDRIELLYTHATTVEDAAKELVGIPRESVIAIGPAIGFFVDEQADKNGSILRAD